MGWRTATLIGSVAAVLSCRHEVASSRNPSARCPGESACPEPEVLVERVYADPLECREAKRILTIRNARLEERLDQCEAKGNRLVDCMRWVFGYLPEGSPGNR